MVSITFVCKWFKSIRKVLKENGGKISRCPKNMGRKVTTKVKEKIIELREPRFKHYAD